ncbi:sensor histidine kinase [Ekhidna sp.]
MALITSPLLGIYNVTPISLLLSSDLVISNLQAPFFDNPFGFLLPASFITVNALMLWGINIWLVSWFQREKITIKGNLRYLLSYAFVFLLLLLIQQTMNKVRPIPIEIGNMRYFPFIGAMVNNTIILILIELMLTRSRKAQLELEKAQLEVLNEKSRYNQLKQQIKPHFLFNALNTLKLLVKNKTENAENFVINLSNFLRSTLTDQSTEIMLIKKDFEIFEDFMQLQQVRFPDALNYACDIPLKVQETNYLPAFTLQILAENATKHNSMSKQHPLKISIKYKNESIIFSNNINPKRKEPESTGIGLNNLSERFQILSGSDIAVEKQDNQFKVSFKVIDNTRK